MPRSAKPRQPRRRKASGDGLGCPKCGAAQDLKPVTIIRPGEPALAALFNGSLNVCTCSACGVKFHLEATLVYRDDHREAVVVLVPADGEEERALAETQMTAIITTTFAGSGEPAANADIEHPGPRICRLTFSRRDMIEKIALLTNCLDDRLVEFMKYQLFRNRRPELDPVRNQLLYDFSPQEKQNLGFVLFDRESGKATTGLHVPMDMYRELAAALLGSEDMKSELAELFPGYVVSADRILAG